MNPPQLLQAMFRAALAAADPLQCVPPWLPAPPPGRTVVVGAGKAAAAMARAVELHWPGPLTGLVITRYGHGLPCERIEVIEAGHPVPDAAGVTAALRIREMLQGLSAQDLVLCLLSGGGSALLSLPAAPISLEDKRSINQQLLLSGATIFEINCVRKHLSAVKGGRLALSAAPARLLSLIISDVPGDDPSVIASGPTLPDPSTREQALQVLRRYAVRVSPSVQDWLQSAASETPKPGDPRLAGQRHVLIATPQRALEAAARQARLQGLEALILGDAIEGEARECAKVHAGIANACFRHGVPAQPPCVLLSGGETTVTVRGQGRGGRNAEFLLALGLALGSQRDVWAVACDTDGIDGTEDNAGAILRPDTLDRAQALGLDAAALLADNDAYACFEALGDLLLTGPTRTNVNDFRAILIASREPAGDHHGIVSSEAAH
jgi:hydroxypyruvate reductase